MIATTVLLSRALGPVEQIVASWRVLAEGRQAWRRLTSLLGEERPDGLPMALPRPRGELTATNVNLRLPGSEHIVLAGVSLELKAGEALAIIGPSAAGKSSLLRILVGFWKPTTGVVRLDGADLSQWRSESLGPWIGYMPQDVQLFPGTVAENIARLEPADAERVVHAATRARVHDLILSLPQGYDTMLDDAGDALSPGQRQRIALARALYGDVRLLVLDEPNANLDGAGEQALADVLRDLHGHVTVVVVTHRSPLIQHVDKLLVLEAGRVKHHGSRSDVLARMNQPAGTVVPLQRAPAKKGASTTTE
jgi:ABC-type protease/lipase transport system fused ATPase/permease subunit